MIKFSKDHTWIKVEDNIGTVGITDYAQKQLKSIIFIEMPGKKVEKGKPAATIESVKSVSDVISPVTGEVAEANKVLSKDPALINRDSMNKGWIFKVKLEKKEELNSLMSQEEYNKFLKK